MSGDDSKIDNVKTYLDTPNENNYLYQGVLRGVGVMIGKMDNRMKGTIQKLFRSGKIYMLLATDSLGIGANVLAQHIYIHSLEKPDEGGFAPIDRSSLIQLVNRAGRHPKKIPNAFIYCGLKDYDKIKTAINSDPSLFVGEIPFDQIKDKIKDKGSLLRYLGKELFG
jgi:replicative superfamily II helicase